MVLNILCMGIVFNKIFVCHQSICYNRFFNNLGIINRIYVPAFTFKTPEEKYVRVQNLIELLHWINL
jgi:hypothetical protein